MTPPGIRKLYTISSLLMAALFAFSASFQFNDLDWYFWIPLYAGGSAVNLMSCCWWITPMKTIQRMANFCLWLGIFLFVKVIAASDIEVVGIWSLDMTERVVREKLGSGLVFVSMIFQLAASSSFHIQTYLYFGIRLIAGVALICGASLVFLLLLTGSIVMHSASSSVEDDPSQFKLAKFVDYGTVLLIGTNYGLFFVLFLLLLTSTILKTSSSPIRARNKEDRLQTSIAYGMAALAGIGYGLSVVFHLYHKDEMVL